MPVPIKKNKNKKDLETRAERMKTFVTSKPPQLTLDKNGDDEDKPA